MWWCCGKRLPLLALVPGCRKWRRVPWVRKKGDFCVSSRIWRRSREQGPTHENKISLSWGFSEQSLLIKQLSCCYPVNSYPVVVPELHKFIQDLPQIRRKWCFDFQEMCTGYLGWCCAYTSFSLLPWHRMRRMAHISLIPFNIPALACVGLDSWQNHFVICSDRHMSTHGIDVWLIAECYFHKEIFL